MSNYGIKFYDDDKIKITGEPSSQPIIPSQEDQSLQTNFNDVQNMESNTDPNLLINQPLPNQQQPIYSENLDNIQNINEENNNFYPNY